MKNKLWLVLALMLALLLPVFALAETVGPFTVTGGEHFVDYEYSEEENVLYIISDANLTISGGTAAAPIDSSITVDGEEGQANLTLNGLHLQTDDYHAFSGCKPVVFTLAPGSQNTLAATYGEDGDPKSGISVQGPVTIGGSGKLGISSANDVAVVAEGAKLTVTGGTVTANGLIYGIGCADLAVTGGVVNANGETNTGIAVEGGDAAISGGKVTARGRDMGLYFNGNKMNVANGTLDAKGGYVGVVVEQGQVNIGGGKVKAEGKYFGFEVVDGEMNVSGGEVEATGTSTSTEETSIGIVNHQGDLNVTGGKVTAVGTNEVGIQLDNGNAAIEGGVVGATGGKVGLLVQGKLDISGGKVTAKGESEDGIAAYDGHPVAISGGAVEAEGGAFAVNSAGGESFIISGGSVLMKSEHQALTNPFKLVGSDFVATASENYGGSPAAGYDENTFDLYRYIRVGKRCVVSFDMQGLGEPPMAQGVLWGGRVIKPANPTAPGYVFDGWYKDAACTRKWDFDNDIVEGNTTLYAKFWNEQQPAAQPPKTGDDNQPMLYLALLVMSLLGMVTLRKRAHS